MEAGMVARMSARPTSDYLAGLAPEQREVLERVNGPALGALLRHLAASEAIAFVGAGASMPLYPVWTDLMAQLVDAGADRLTHNAAATCRELAKQHPEEVMEILRRQLGTAGYRDVLRWALRVQTDPVSGRSWTPVHELICRCAFKGIVTTNYDPGIVDARMRVRPRAIATGFTTWADELGLDGWRTGDVFEDQELPVLFAHGQHNQPDTIVLATTEYRRAYEGKLSRVLGQLADSAHLVWIGFSFADRRIKAILDEIRRASGTRLDPGSPPRHVAIMPWDPSKDKNDPRILVQQTEIEYGALLLLYPKWGDDHSSLARLLATMVDSRFPPVPDTPLLVAPTSVRSGRAISGRRRFAERWIPEPEFVEHFVGRAEELARLDRWAADPDVNLIAVTAWGGAGKTTLVTHWAQQRKGSPGRPVRGIFAWSFYADASAERWAASLLEWAEEEFGLQIKPMRLAERVLALLRKLPLLLVLDGLEIVQEGPAGEGFGRLLDGTLREVLAGICRARQAGLIVLTSRFPFADLESFDGTTARMLEVPAFTLAEGAKLIAAEGGDWLAEKERRELVAAVDGHALAVGVLAGLLADHLPSSELAALRQELSNAGRTHARVAKVLQFYSEKLSPADRYLVAAVSLFAHPVSANAVLTVGRHPAFQNRLRSLNGQDVEEAVRARLTGLVSLHPNGTLSAHPLVRDSFRTLAMGAAQIAADTTLTGLPEGQVANRADALWIVEAIELLLDARQWQAADDLHTSRTGTGLTWQDLPAARLGQRAASAFVATVDRRRRCAKKLGKDALSFYVNGAGLYALIAGDVLTGLEYLLEAVKSAEAVGDSGNLSVALHNLAECYEFLGDFRRAHTAAVKSLDHAMLWGEKEQIRYARAYLGWITALTGDSRTAEQCFIDADEALFVNDQIHLYGLPGVLWGQWLSRTGRTKAATELTRRNLSICARRGWNDEVARCERLLGRLTPRGSDAAALPLQSAANRFREGEFLIELAATLVDMAENARSCGDLDAAENHLSEAISIASPRQLVPIYSDALVVRALISADRAERTHESRFVTMGRDAADSALRLARRHHMPWSEISAALAQARLDEAEDTDNGWSSRAADRRSRLVPSDLLETPLTSIEAQAKEQQAGPRTPDSLAAERRSELSGATDPPQRAPAGIYSRGPVLPTRSDQDPHSAGRRKRRE
jgi:hypothetical protein